MCLPCAKEIIDNRTDGALRGAHAVAQMLPSMVERGQIGSVDAEDRLNTLMALEKQFIADLEAWGNSVVAISKSPWEVKPSS